MKYAKDIEEFIGRLFEAERLYADAARTAAQLEAEYKLARAAVYLDGKGTIKDKEASADLVCENLHKGLTEADAEVAIYRAAMDNLRVAISATQSMLSAESRAHYVQDTMKQI